MYKSKKSFPKIHPEQDNKSKKIDNKPPPPSIKPPPPSIKPPPPSNSIPQPVQPNQPTFIDTLSQGFAWGIGTSMAKKIFNSESKPDSNTINNSYKEEKKLTSDDIFIKYEQCLENRNPDERCEDILSK
jgi:hypothetical protein